MINHDYDFTSYIEDKKRKERFAKINNLNEENKGEFLLSFNQLLKRYIDNYYDEKLSTDDIKAILDYVLSQVEVLSISASSSKNYKSISELVVEIDSRLCNYLKTDNKMEMLFALQMATTMLDIYTPELFKMAVEG